MRHLPVTVLALLLGGCASSPRAAPTTAPAGKLPALATRPAGQGEIVVRGDSSPASLGPYSFTGRYLVRFAQYAPENAKLDFATQTPFTAALTVQQGDPRRAVKLFQQAAAAGQRVVALHGRYYVDVSFGDYPFVVRFSPSP